MSFPTKEGVVKPCLKLWAMLWMFTVTFLPILAGEIVGEMPGGLSQTASGSASTSLTIELPPGPASVMPNITLSYDSNGRNGLLGVGFQLQSGLSRISRVGQTYDMDGRRTMVALDDQGSFAEDRLALDGNRLVLVSGSYGGDDSVYYTRSETYQKVVAINDTPEILGPEGFYVYLPDGSVRHYGKYQNHRIQKGGDDTPVYSWLLSEVTDRYGRRRVYDYFECPDGSEPVCDGAESREYLPRMIWYEGRTVLFEYETRPDKHLQYEAGLPFSQSQRLVRLKIYVNADGDSNHVEQEDYAYQYRLAYAEPNTPGITMRSRLVSVAKESADGTTFPPTTFEWLGDNAAVGFTSFPGYDDSRLPFFAKVRGWANQKYNGKYNQGTHMVDLNGDGLKDIIQGIYFTEDSNGNGQEIKRKIFLNSVTGWQKLEDNHPYLADWSAAGSGALFSVRSKMGGDHPGGDLGTRFADLNGDGLVDMVQLADGDKAEHQQLSKPDTRMRILLNMGEDEGWDLLPDSHPWIQQMAKQSNGDPALYVSKLYREQVYHIGNRGGGTVIADLNGDGRADLLNMLSIGGGRHYDVYLNKGDDATDGGWQKVNAYHDSLSYMYDPNTDWNPKSFFAESITHNQGSSVWRSDVGLRLRDLNGDGLPDLILLNRGFGNYPTIAQVALNLGPELGFVYDSGYSDSLPTDADAPYFTECQEGSAYDTLGTRLMDLNGDGLPDLVRLYSTGYGQIPTKRLLLNTGQGFVEPSNWIMPGDDVFFTYDGRHDGGARLADLNGDGLTDVVTLFYDEAGQHRRSLYLGEHSDGFRGWREATPVDGENDWWTGIPGDLFFTGRDDDHLFDMGSRIDDVNGDGRLDLVQLAEVEGVYTERRFFLGSANPKTLVDNTASYQTGHEKIWRMRSGVGGITEVAYAPLSFGGTLYRKGNSATYPVRDLAPTRILVSQLLRHQPMGNSATSQTRKTTFNYRHYLAALDNPNGGQPGNDGGGAIGFRYIDSIDENAQITTRTYYSENDWRYWGRIRDIRSFPVGDFNHPIGRQVMIYQVDDNLWGQPGLTYRVLRDRENNYLHEDGQLFLTTQVRKDYDAFGNVTRELHFGDVNNGADNRYIHYFYQNDINAWRFGQKTREVHSISGDATATQYYRNVIDYAFDSAGNLTTKTWNNLEKPEQNAVTGYEYDSWGNLVRETSPTQVVTAYSYDPTFNFFQVSKTRDPEGLAHAQTYQYDAAHGGVTHFWDINGVLTRTTYDAMGRKTAIYRERPNDAVVTMTERILYRWANATRKQGFYKEVRRLKEWDASINESWLKTRDYYDAWGRRYLSWTRGSGDSTVVHVHTIYDNLGRVFKQSLPYFSNGTPKYVTKTYDSAGREIQSQFPVLETGDTPEIETYTYSYETLGGKNYPLTIFEGRRLASGDSGKITTTRYDGRQRVLERRYVEDDGTESSTFFQYDALDRRTAVFSQENRDGRRIRTISNWDSLNRKTRVLEDIVSENADGTWQVHHRQTFLYQYDLDGRQTRYTGNTGNEVHTSYDVLGREAGKMFLPTNTGELRDIVFLYDQGSFGQGKLSEVTGQDGNGDLLFHYQLDYDKYGNVDQETVQYDSAGTWTLSYAYRADRLKTTTTYPDGSVLTRGYTSLNWPGSLDLDESDRTGVITVDFKDHYPSGAPGKVVYGNGAVTDYHYDPHNWRLATMDIFDSQEQLIAGKTYGWTDRGQLETIEDDADQSLNQIFTYDAQLRLKTANGIYDAKAYNYDPMGNLLDKGAIEMQDFSGSRLDRAYDHRQQITIDYTYDSNGNTIQRKAGEVIEDFRYNALDRLVAYQRQDPVQGLVANTFAYDHSGRRYKKVDSDGGTTYYVTPAFEILRLGDLTRETKYVSGPEGKLAQTTKTVAPDLSVTLVATEVPNYHSLRIRATIHNVGNAPSRPFSVSVAGPQGSQTLAAPALEPGATHDLDVTINAVFEDRILLTVDADDEVRELDEDNNVLQHVVDEGPDLDILNVTAIPKSAETFRLRVTLRNRGTVVAPWTELGIFSKNGPGSYWPLPALPPGEIHPYEMTLSAAEGEYLKFIADANQAAVETDEQNNGHQTLLAIPDFTLVDGMATFDSSKNVLVASVGMRIDKTVAMTEIAVQVRNLRTRQNFDGLAKIGEAGTVFWYEGVVEGMSGDAFLATVNPGNEVYEPRFTNNAKQFSWASDFDLRPTGMSGVSPGECLEKFTAIFANDGSQSLEKVDLWVQISKAEGQGVEVLETHKLTAQNIPAGGIGKSLVKLERIWCEPLSVRITVDPENLLPEMNEENNVDSYIVKPMPSSQPGSGSKERD